MGTRHRPAGAIVVENLSEATKTQAELRDEVRPGSDSTVSIPESNWARRASLRFPGK